MSNPMSLDEIKAKIKEKIEGTKSNKLIVETKVLVDEIAPEYKKFIFPTNEVPIKKHDASMTREAWLISASDMLRGYLSAQHNIIIPQFRVSVGFPNNKRDNGKMKGCVVKAQHTKDNIAQVFVTPIAQDSVQVLTVLATEMLQVKANSLGTSSIVKLAAQVGMSPNELVANASTTYFGAPFYLNELNDIAMHIGDTLGVYPHGGVKANGAPKRDTSGIKVYCVDGGYKARVSDLWLTKYGAPICPCCSGVMKIESKVKEAPKVESPAPDAKPDRLERKKTLEAIEKRKAELKGKIEDEIPF